jgi:crotonobetainyl-CoA:carnitine CoA-transferase CaiB-like acyl-CoA transferase
MRNPPELPEYRRSAAVMPTALEGILVVDFTHFVAGPFATQTLADLGANVVKVEHPVRGDDFRASRIQPDDDIQALFLSTNRNKRSVGIDLGHDEGGRIARELVDRADVVVENFSTGIMERFGLGYDEVSKEHPELIYCSVSAAGRDGSMSGRVGFDTIAQAETVFMRLNGRTDGLAALTGPAVIDVTTAMSASNSILAALVARSRLGVGQFVEVSLFDQGVSLLGYQGYSYLATGVYNSARRDNPQRRPGVGTYRTADDPLLLCCATERTYRKLVVGALDLPVLAEPPYDVDEARRADGDKLNEIIEGVLRQRPLDDWLVRLREAGVPAGAVRELEDALVDHDVNEREMVHQIDHPTHGPVPNISSPMRPHGTPIVDPVAAPEVGQHTDDVLRDVLAYPDDRLAALRADGVIG